jgi:predicted nucleotidyltransferase
MFRSGAQLSILGELFCGSQEAYTLTELAAAAQTSAATAGREVERLRENGIVVVSPGPGRSKLVSANWGMPWAGDLRRILVHTGGLVPALERALGGDPRIRAAYIFGSWARRYHGEPGHFPRDIDLVVVTDVSQFELDVSWRTVARDLGVELNPIYRPSDFDPATDGLIAGSPIVKLSIERNSS